VLGKAQQQPCELSRLTPANGSKLASNFCREKSVCQPLAVLICTELLQTRHL